MYSYGDSNWGDKLTAYRGESITYDEVGNPLSYYNGKRYTFTWENGRRLETATVDGVTLTFTYNDEGIRTSKTVGGSEHIYHLNGSQIVTETWGHGQMVIIYLYDAEGSPIGMKYRGGNMAVGEFEEYWFEKNLQGDIVAVYNAAGTKLISYTYDAWGNFTTTYHNGCTASHNANLNPFRYRGYYYDCELGMYYLQSRYYDPVIGRYINADGYLSTGQGLLGYNMFAYCGNNPVNRVDPEGKSWIALLIVVAVSALILSGCSSDPSPRSDLAKAPDLDVDTASPDSYNCYGNGIGKQINTDPTGYKQGDSTRETFEAVKKDLGGDHYVRELDSIDSPIADDEFRVAMKCGPTDYHFIRQLDDGTWYNKSGLTTGLPIPEEYIVNGPFGNGIWYGYSVEYGISFPFYTDETIYFAIKKGWDTQ